MTPIMLKVLVLSSLVAVGSCFGMKRVHDEDIQEGDTKILRVEAPVVAAHLDPLKDQVIIFLMRTLKEQQQDIITFIDTACTDIPSEIIVLLIEHYLNKEPREEELLAHNNERLRLAVYCASRSVAAHTGETPILDTFLVDKTTRAGGRKLSFCSTSGKNCASACDR